MKFLLSGSPLRLPSRTLKDGFHYRICLQTSFRVDLFGMKYLEISVTSMGMRLMSNLQVCAKMGEEEQGLVSSSPLSLSYLSMSSGG